jgi:hypothetical protein
MTTSKASPNIAIAHIITHKPTGRKTICVSRKQTAVRLQQIAKGLGQTDIKYINEDLIPLIASGRLHFRDDDVMSTLSIEIQDEDTVEQFVASVIDHHQLVVAAPTDSTDSSNDPTFPDNADSTDNANSTEGTEFLMAPDSTCLHLKPPEQESDDEWLWDDSGSSRSAEKTFDQLFDED